METKIQLSHPDGKKAITMDKQKYTIVSEAILKLITTKGALTYSEILQGVTDEFRKNRTEFNGSLSWHLEWIKLDLEARRKIKRVELESTVKYIIV